MVKYMAGTKELQSIIDSSGNIVFFGGAGVSTESGIPDFRSGDGLYQQKYAYPPEVIVSHSFFETHTEEFFEYYKKAFIYLDKKPNAAHYKLAELEKAGKLKAVITQNVDGFHSMAGSKRVFELHGSVHRNFCMNCGKSYDAEFIQAAKGVPKCSCGGTVKPDVVLYEEGLNGDTLSGAVEAISKAEVMIVAGTSLTVYPAAGLLRYFKGKSLVLINKDRTPYDDEANLVIRGKVGEVLGSITVKN